MKIIDRGSLKRSTASSADGGHRKQNMTQSVSGGSRRIPSQARRAGRPGGGGGRRP